MRPAPDASRPDPEALAAYTARCRSLLRAYPAAWRRTREAEVLAVLLDLRDEQGASSTSGRGRRPSWAVHVDLVDGGLQARWDRAWSFLPVAVRDRVAVVSTVLGAVVCTLALVVGEIAWPWRRLPADLVPGTAPSPLLQTAGIGVYGTWLLALGAAVLLGRVGAARRLLAGTAVLALVLAVAPGVPRPPLYVLGPVAAAAVLATTGRLPTARTARGWTALAYVVLTGGLGLLQLADTRQGVLDPVTSFYRYEGVRVLSADLVCVLLVAALVAAGASAAGRPWFLATAVSAVPFVHLCAFALTGTRDVAAVLSVTGTLGAAALLLALGVVLGRRSRPAPPSRADQDAPGGPTP